MRSFGNVFFWQILLQKSAAADWALLWGDGNARRLEGITCKSINNGHANHSRTHSRNGILLGISQVASDLVQDRRRFIRGLRNHALLVESASHSVSSDDCA